MKTLYITTTRENMEDDELAQYPLSGAIFTLPVAVAGMKKFPFANVKPDPPGPRFR